MSETKKDMRKCLEKPTPEREETEEDITSQHESRVVIPETSSGTKRVSILFRGITKHWWNQLLNGVTEQEGQQSPLVSDHLHHISESPSYIKESDHQEGCTMTHPASLFQYGKIWDEEKRKYNEQLNPISDLDKGLLSKNGHNYILGILNHVQTSEVYLDVNTAGNNVAVRSDLRSAYWTVEDQCYPKRRKRFKDCQVLSMNSFCSGQHIWLVETSKSGNWRIGMCYPSIARKGFRSYIGCSDKSWGLCKWNNEYSVMHNCKEMHLSPGLSGQWIAISLDVNAGHLSFYELGNPVRHIHTFTATFTEPLHAVFRIWLDSLGSSWILIRN